MSRSVGHCKLRKLGFPERQLAISTLAAVAPRDLKSEGHWARPNTGMSRSIVTGDGRATSMARAYTWRTVESLSADLASAVDPSVEAYIFQHVDDLTVMQMAAQWHALSRTVVTTSLFLQQDLDLLHLVTCQSLASGPSTLRRRPQSSFGACGTGVVAAGFDEDGYPVDWAAMKDTVQGRQTVPGMNCMAQFNSGGTLRRSVESTPLTWFMAVPAAKQNALTPICGRLSARQTQAQAFIPLRSRPTTAKLTSKHWPMSASTTAGTRSMRLRSTDTRGSSAKGGTMRSPSALSFLGMHHNAF